MTRLMVCALLLTSCTTPQTTAGAARQGKTPAPVVTTSAPSRMAAPRKAARVRRVVESPAPGQHLLTRIARCESGGDPTAQNRTSSASGLYQFIDATWRAYRGAAGRPYAHARHAPAAVQTAAAVRLLAAEGTSPWNASRRCWA